MNELLDDSSQKWPSKLWTMAKAFASTAQKEVESLVQDFQGENWKAKTINTIESAFSGFTQKFAQSLEKNKTAELIPDTPFLMTSPKSTLPTHLNDISLTSPSQSSSSSREIEQPDRSETTTYKK